MSYECKEIVYIRGLMKLGYRTNHHEDEQGTLWYKSRICVPSDSTLHDEILSEAHDSKYCIHPGGAKMYQDLKKHFWWKGMKKAIAEHVARCDTSNRVKVEHGRPAGLLKPLDIPKWKWECITMDFIVGLPKTQKGNDSIWVIVDRLTKVAHFVPVKVRHSAKKLADLYIEHILRLHGAPSSIMPDRGSQFMSKFWKTLHDSIGTSLDYSTTYHP
jgi:hypothetical protein